MFCSDLLKLVSGEPRFVVFPLLTGVSNYGSGYRICTGFKPIGSAKLIFFLFFSRSKFSKALALYFRFSSFFSRFDLHFSLAFLIIALIEAAPAMPTLIRMLNTTINMANQPKEYYELGLMAKSVKTGRLEQRARIVSSL